VLLLFVTATLYLPKDWCLNNYILQEVHQLRAKIFTLENELDRLKVEASEKDQLSKQVNSDVLCNL